MFDPNSNVSPFLRCEEPDARMAAIAGIFSAFARSEVIAVIKALEAGALNRLALCRRTGRTVFQIAATMKLMINQGLVSAWRQNNETIYALMDPRLGEVVQLVEQLAAPMPRQVAS